ncbi:MAG: hypothetical protein KKG04_05295, partial [Candidatus Thermoplasmatota archaeon]|nr:hypothetical protein [Candidatus Thermoplasmatota archaeon]
MAANYLFLSGIDKHLYCIGISIVVISRMLINPVDIFQLVIGIGVISFPGYLWSWWLPKTLKQYERVVFGFIVGLIVIGCVPFLLLIGFQVPISQSSTILVFSLYAVSAVCSYAFFMYRR